MKKFTTEKVAELTNFSRVSIPGLTEAEAKALADKNFDMKLFIATAEAHEVPDAKGLAEQLQQKKQVTAKVSVVNGQPSTSIFDTILLVGLTALVVGSGLLMLRTCQSVDRLEKGMAEVKGTVALNLAAVTSKNKDGEDVSVLDIARYIGNHMITEKYLGDMHLVTEKYLDDKHLVTEAYMDELDLATKDDIAPLAKSSDMRKVAKKEDVKDLAKKSDVEDVGRKVDVVQDTLNDHVAEEKKASQSKPQPTSSSAGPTHKVRFHHKPVYVYKYTSGRKP